MLRFSGSDVPAYGFGTVGLDGNGDDCHRGAGITKLGVQGLPTWQVIAAASIGGPADDHDFLATELRERNFVAVEVVEHNVRCFGRVECVSAE